MDEFTGEIRISAGAWAWRDWAYCDGALLSIGQYPALYSIISNIYGGDGINTVGLPNLRGRVPVHAGQGPGLTDYPLGGHLGWPSVTLLNHQMPPHTHAVSAFDANAESTDVGAQMLPATGYDPNTLPIKRAKPQYISDSATPSLVQMDWDAIDPTGGNQAHSNQQPYLAVAFLMCLDGNYPQRS